MKKRNRKPPTVGWFYCTVTDTPFYRLRNKTGEYLEDYGRTEVYWQRYGQNMFSVPLKTDIYLGPF